MSPTNCFLGSLISSHLSDSRKELGLLREKKRQKMLLWQKATLLSFFFLNPSCEVGAIHFIKGGSGVLLSTDMEITERIYVCELRKGYTERYPKPCSASAPSQASALSFPTLESPLEVLSTDVSMAPRMQDLHLTSLIQLTCLEESISSKMGQGSVNVFKRRRLVSECGLRMIRNKNPSGSSSVACGCPKMRLFQITDEVETMFLHF